MKTVLKNRKLHKYAEDESCFPFILLSLLMIVGLLSYLSFWNKIPSRVFLKAGAEETLDLNLPADGTLYRKDVPAMSSQNIKIDLRRPVTFRAEQMNQYQLEIQLFGVIPLKNVEVEVIKETLLKPAGVPIGIYVKTEGVMVIDTGEFEDESGKMVCPTKNVFSPGDYILEVNDEKVTSKKDFINKIKWSDGQDLIFKLRREDQEIYVMAKPLADQNGEYKLGVWIRDNAQGVGTMTFVDQNGNFGALGHGINDVDTGKLMQLENGNLYHTEIIGITRGRGGSPGELTGFIEYDDRNVMGTIFENTNCGIFGHCEEKLIEEIDAVSEREYLEIGLKQEIKKGPAEILCEIDDEVKAYDIEITDVNLTKDHINRGIVLKVTDPELLEKTGGIVQGMSGSPIIQNGKMIGAVTHVLVQDSTKGYGIFIENMLEHG